ncbi:MAG: calcium/sodium antiporter [Rikenellaceae bacterium]
MVYAYLVLGLTLILVGANIFTEAASALAKKFNISDFIIGLTVVAIGTSMPELIISTIAALKGSGDMAIGNVLGSNIFNTLAIIGITVIIAPINLTKGNIRKDIPFSVMASALLLVIALVAFYTGKDSISRIEGLVLLVLFVLFILHTISAAKKSKDSDSNVEEAETVVQTKQKPMWLTILLALLGLAGLVCGGEVFLDSATKIAKQLNISDAVIAITIMSAGTSFPELATCVVAAIKGKGEMALGNVVGSNISNILLVLGASASATKLSFGDITVGNILFLFIASVLIFIAAFTFKKNKIDRYEGVIFTLLYMGYTFYLLH